MVRRNMGLTGQVATVDELLTGRENIRMIGGLYGIGRRDLDRLGDQLLEQFSIADAADRPVRAYSGGMRRRLDLAVSLIASPPVLFLDEPTTGLDPRSRSDLWEMLRGLVAEGTTLLLTTQYLEEADQLADNIVVMTTAGSSRRARRCSSSSKRATPAWSSRSPTPQTCPRPGSCSPAPGAEVHCRHGRAAVSPRRPRDRGYDPCRRLATEARSKSTTSDCPGPAWTMFS